MWCPWFVLHRGVYRSDKLGVGGVANKDQGLVERLGFFFIGFCRWVFSELGLPKSGFLIPNSRFCWGFIRWFWDPVIGMLLRAAVATRRLLLADDQRIAVLVCEVMDFKTCVSWPRGYCLCLELIAFFDVCLFLSMKSPTILTKKKKGYGHNSNCKRVYWLNYVIISCKNSCGHNLTKFDYLQLVL